MRHPVMYELNTRVYLFERSRTLGRPATLDDMPDQFLDELATRGCEWLWLMGVWQTGQAGRTIARTHGDIRNACARALSDLSDEDITGSPFAVQQYSVNAEFGGDAALARLRQRMSRCGLGLMLDFIANHCAIDHPWVTQHPEYFIHGTDADLQREPHNWVRVSTGQRQEVLAHGRDPYFPGWTDTLQLNYRHNGCRRAMLEEMGRAADRCDGLRCDMAMLAQPDVFQRTWGERSIPRDGTAAIDEPFWPDAIANLRRHHPNHLMLAEVYWDLEWRLQQQGFDYTYDKGLCDRLRGGNGRAVREHLMAAPSFQDRLVRFLENHDEPRAASALPADMHRAAAVITYLAPGMRMLHDGQLEGRRTQLPVQLRRRPEEATDANLRDFYHRLLTCVRRPEAHDGEFHLWSCRPAWTGNDTCSPFVTFSWESQRGRRMLVAVNYGPNRGQCYINAGLQGLTGRHVTLTDLMSDARFERAGDELATQGMYVDMAPWGYHVFELATR
jgi:hypothetical protein